MNSFIVNHSDLTAQTLNQNRAARVNLESLSVGKPERNPGGT